MEVISCRFMMPLNILRIYVSECANHHKQMSSILDIIYLGKFIRKSAKNK